MSTAAAPKPATGYEVGRPHGHCAACGQQIPPDEKFMAALRETPGGFERLDCMLGPCWDQLDRASIIAFWRTTMPRAEAKRKLFVDDEVLCGLFERLADTTEPAKLNFRFVLGLILMRKRMLVYESSRKEPAVAAADGAAAEREIWSVRFRGKDALMDLLDPRLAEEQVMAVSRQLGEILNEEL